MKTIAQFINTNSITIHIERAGVEKQPIILLHGITDNGRCMLRLAEHLASDYDVILVDARGHGQSEAPEVGYSADHHADDVAGVISSLGLKNPILYGHSMGARTAVRFAAKYPETLTAVILEDPVYIIPPTEAELAQRDMWLAEMKISVKQGHALTVAEHLKNAKQQGHPDWRESDQLEWAKSKRQVQPQVFDIGQTMHLIRDDFPQIQSPVLILKADDTPENQAANQDAAALISNGKIFHIPGTGHNVRRDNWAATILHLDDFLKALN
jgi:N-formylmaleamate deformylase